MACELCTGGTETHPDDLIRIMVENTNYCRPAYVCPRCLRKFQRCKWCRWYENNKCRQGPFTVTKGPMDYCGYWRQDKPVRVEKMEEGCKSKFRLV